jgi:hypothetical protein
LVDLYHIIILLMMLSDRLSEVSKLWAALARRA